MDTVEHGILQHIAKLLPKGYLLSKNGDNPLFIASPYSAKSFGTIKFENKRGSHLINVKMSDDPTEYIFNLADPDSFSKLGKLFGSLLPKYWLTSLKKLTCSILGHKDRCKIKNAPKDSGQPIASWQGPAPKNNVFTISHSPPEDSIIFGMSDCVEMGIKICERCGQPFFQHRINQIVDED